jgi:hypothetical protein
MNRVRILGIALGLVCLTASGGALADDVKVPKKAAPKPKVEAAEPAADDGGEADIANEARPISVAPLLGYGTDGLNVGLGIRAGYTLPNHIYLGGTFVYHLGESVAASVVGYGTSVHVFYPAGEAGYDIHIKHVTLRPYGGVGVLFASVSTHYPGLQDTSATSSALGLYPGFTAAWEIPNTQAFIGGDARLLFSLNGGDPSFGVFATGGMRF